MKPPDSRTYRIAAFAALAGVTPRALRHYERLGLLRPERSSTGYRVYTAGDLRRLQEIVALKFIGIPLKEIAAIRRRPGGPLVQALRAQRRTLEARRRTLTRVIAALAGAEVSLQSAAPIDEDLFRGLIEVMNMETRHEQTVERYSAMLKETGSRLSTMPSRQRATLREQWSTLVEDVRGSLDADPGGPAAQSLLDRWLAFLQALRGAAASEATGREPGDEASADARLRDELWARRTEWLPADAARDTGDLTAEDALKRVRERLPAVVDAGVLDFIGRARAARG